MASNLTSGATDSSAKTPLCVDLDGTLVRTDTLLELFVRALFHKPGGLLTALLQLRRGKAPFKKALTDLIDIDPGVLPYNSEFLDHLRSQHSQGRTLVLATASNESLARKIADHVGIFDDVIASSEQTNLRGSEKAAVLQDRFGAKGYSYVGNDKTDLAVWQSAATATFVNTPDRIKAKVAVPVEAEFQADSVTLQLLRALRMYQWAKNVLVFVPVATANALTDITALGNAAITFIGFSMVASGVYLVNDLSDLDADRAHPEKHKRPFASGRLPLSYGVLGPALMLSGMAVGLTVNALLGFTLLVYAIATTAYSTVLKTLPLVDVFTLAALYTMRIVAGGVATGFHATIWLLSFSSFFFLSLAFLKRYVELASLDESSLSPNRRDYLPGEHQLLMQLGVASAFSASIVLALYVELSIGGRDYARPVFVWGLVPLVLFWSCRLWLAAFRGFVDSDPIIYAARDWVSRIVIVLAGACYAAAAFG